MRSTKSEWRLASARPAVRWKVVSAANVEVPSLRDRPLPGWGATRHPAAGGRRSRLNLELTVSAAPNRNACKWPHLDGDLPALDNCR